LLDFNYICIHACLTENIIGTCVSTLGTQADTHIRNAILKGR